MVCNFTVTIAVIVLCSGAADSKNVSSNPLTGYYQQTADRNAVEPNGTLSS